MADGMEQVRFTQSTSAVNKEWVVGLGRCFSDGDGCGMGKPVGRTNHKTFKRVLVV